MPSAVIARKYYTFCHFIEVKCANMTSQRLAGSALILTMINLIIFAAVRGDKARYVGGTVTTINEGTQGRLNLDDRKQLVFAYWKNERFTIPYREDHVYGVWTEGRTARSVRRLLWMSRPLASVPCRCCFLRKRSIYSSLCQSARRERGNSSRIGKRDRANDNTDPEGPDRQEGGARR